MLPKCLKLFKNAFFQCLESHPLCFTCWEKLYNKGQNCPTCRGKLTKKRNFPLEQILNQLDKKKCKFDGCKFERNNQALVTQHEENCEYGTFKCKWSEYGCDFVASTKTLVTDHEEDCERNLPQRLESELSFAGAAKVEKPKKSRRTRKAETAPTLMPNGLCRKHHKYGDQAHKCDLPTECIWNNDIMLPSTSGPSYEQRETSVLDEDLSTCKFHGCSFRNRNSRKVKRHEVSECPLRS